MQCDGVCVCDGICLFEKEYGCNRNDVNEWNYKSIKKT